MNSLDIVLLVTLGFFLVRGLMRGLFKEIASIAGVILGIYLGYKYQPPLTQVCVKLGLSHSWGLSLGVFLFIFIITLVVIRLLAWLVTKALGSGALSATNRLLGAALSGLKATLLISFAVLLISFVLPADAKILKESKLAPYSLNVSNFLVKVITPQINKTWKEQFKGSQKHSEEKPEPKERHI